MFKRYPPISKLPVFMHGADYNPDQWQWDAQVLEEDIRLMKLAGCNAMALGIFSWTALEPEEGVFTFDWLDRVLNRFAQEGIYAWLATPSSGMPAWLAARYPEVLRVAPNRVRQLYGSRQNHCFTSPVFREKVQIINTRLSQRYAHHPAVIGWHISNEFRGECHCPYCQKSFRQWLQNKYGSLEALNQAWWNSFWSHTYTDWSQVESPAPHGEKHNHGMNLDWKRFTTDQTVDFYRHEAAPLKAANPELPATTNLMGPYEGLDYRKFADVLDVVSWDAYFPWHNEECDRDVAVHASFCHDLMRGLKRRPFVLMESTPSQTNWQAICRLKKPGMHRLSSLQAVAHGSDTVQYFQWRKSLGASEKFHGAIVDHAGHEHTRVFREVSELGATLGGLAEVLGTDTEAKAAILFDWDNRWAVKDAQGPRNKGIHYDETVLQHYRAFWELGVPVDVIGASDTLDRYKLVVAPMLYMCRQETGEKLEQFVLEGGTLVVTYWSGIVNESDRCHLGGFPGPLRKVLGIWSEEIDALDDGEKNAILINAPVPRENGVISALSGMAGEYESFELCELAHAETAHVLGVYRDNFYAGRPALTVNRLGKGQAYYLATRALEPFYSDFYRAVSKEAGIRPLLETKLPQGVTVQARTDGEQDYLFMMNFSGKEQTIELDGSRYRNIETALELTEPFLKLPVYGVAILARGR